jgi:hypothetical protein
MTVEFVGKRHGVSTSTPHPQRSSAMTDPHLLGVFILRVLLEHVIAVT